MRRAPVRPQVPRPLLLVGLGVAMATAAALAGPGCEGAGGPATAPAAASAPQRPRSPAPPRRVVSLAPSLTEIVFALGAGERLVGVTSHCDFPPAARALPRVGGYGSPNVELVLACRPDLVLVPAEGTLLAPALALRRLGVRLEAVTVTALPDLFAAVERLGTLLGEKTELRARTPRRDAARAHRGDTPRRRQSAATPAPSSSSTATRRLPPDRAPSSARCSRSQAEAMCCRRAAGAGPRSARRRSWRWRRRWSSSSAWHRPAPPRPRPPPRARFWERLSGVPAVRSGRVHALPPELLVRPGPRLVDGLQALARALHPEAFPGEPEAAASAHRPPSGADPR
ncbi:MAG: hypothetical protein KatS3mg102_1743 [Planctomycetota bacterium]|nr:MAG: hypothetical protein KatS3mg102_1743 [Planctomycetota bacterium]